MPRPAAHRALTFAVLLVAVQLCSGQLTTGNLKILVLNDRNKPQPGVSILVAGRPSSLLTVHADSRGESELALPYGEYRLSSGDATQTIYVAPLQTVRTTLFIHRTTQDPSFNLTYPGSYSMNGLLLAMETATVSAPLDFSGLASMRLPLLSTRAYSWTDTRYALQGMNATDPYQPGRTMIFPAVDTLSDIAVR